MTNLSRMLISFFFVVLLSACQVLHEHEENIKTHKSEHPKGPIHNRPQHERCNC